MAGRQFVDVLKQFFTLKNVILFLCWIQSSSVVKGYGDLLVNSTIICDICVNLCEMSQVDEILVADCQRGCRLFDTLFIQNPLFVKFDEAVALNKCNNSCCEAYDSETRAAMACSDGCNTFQEEYLIKRREVEQELERAERSIFFMLFNPYLSFEELRCSQLLKVDNFHQEIINTRLDSNLANTKSRIWRESPATVPAPTVVVESISKLSNFPAPTVSPTSPVTSWITPSSVTIFVLGIFVILGLTCFCCISNKHPVSNTTTPKSPVETEPPPSYEDVVCIH